MSNSASHDGKIAQLARLPAAGCDEWSHVRAEWFRLCGITLLANAARPIMLLVIPRGLLHLMCVLILVVPFGEPQTAGAGDGRPHAQLDSICDFMPWLPGCG